MTTNTPIKIPSMLQLTLILGILTAFGSMSIDMYLPSLRSISNELHTDMATTQMSLTIFFIGLAFGQALYGPLADRYGRKRPLLIGCALYTIASIVCAAAPAIEVLIAARLLQAIGGCAGMVLARSAVRDLFNEQESARMLSTLMLVMGLSPITAPLIGGQLLLLFSWRAIFWLLAGFGLLCFLLVLFGLPETLPVERRNRAGFGRALAVYGHLLTNRHYMGYTLPCALVSAGMFAYIAGSPFVLIDLHHVAQQNYGWIFGTNAFGMILASQINRRLLAYYRGDTILTTALSVAAVAGLLLLMQAATGFGGLVGLLIPQFVCVASLGLVGPNASAAAMAPNGHVAGSASALLGTLQFVLGALAGTLIGLLDNGTALPMTGVIALCEVSALIIFHMLTSRPMLRTVHS